MPTGLYVRVGLLVCIFGVLLSGGCGRATPGGTTNDDGRSTGPAVPMASVPALTSLPSPRQMLMRDRQSPAKVASYNEGDLQKSGTAFDSVLPHNLVTDDNPPKLDFTPAWSPPGSTLNDLAYCTYHFVAANYDRNDQVRVYWSGPPASTDLWFVGLSHWDSDRWDWYAGTTNGQIDLADISPYFDFSDNLLLVVACLGTSHCMLERVRLGGLPPTASLSANITRGAVPLQVTFDAGDSLPVEGEIVAYKWDFEGEGTYELNTGTVSTAEHTYITNGERYAKVKVVNSNNASDIASVWIMSVGEWRHSWYLGNNDRINDVVIDDDGTIYAVGTTMPSGASLGSILLMRVSPAGNLVWARAWDEIGMDEGYAVELARDGTVIVGGSYTGGAADDALIQKWSTDGELLWSYRHGGDSTDILSEIQVDGNDIYACGATLSTVAAWDYDYFLIRCGGDGLMQWGRARDNYEDENRATGMCLTGDAVTGVEGAAMVGTSISPDGTAAWMVEYEVDGTFTRARELGAPPWHIRARDVLYARNPDTLLTRYYVTGELLDENKVFIHSSNGAGVCQYALRVSTSRPATASRMCYGGSSDILVCGTWEDSDADRGSLWKFDYFTGDLVQMRYMGSGSFPSSFYAVDVRQYGAILAGSGYGRGLLNIAAPATSGFSVSWQDAPGTPTSLVWTWSTETDGIVFDITDDYLGNEDQDGGQLSIMYSLPDS